MKIRTQVTLFSVLGVLFVGGCAIAVWMRAQAILNEKQDLLVESQAVAIGVNTAEMIAATRSIYTSDVVGKLKPTGVAFKQSPHDGEAPLPAVLVSAISQKLSQGSQSDSVGFVLRSGWNINPKQGIATDFERDGWADLLAQGEALRDVPVAERAARFKPFYRRETDASGRPVMQVMTADLAGAKSCIDCHNQLEQTADIRTLRGSAPQKEFQLGDVMGAVVTTVPLAKSEAIVSELATAQTQTSAQLWIAIIAGAGVASFAGVWLGRSLAKRIGSVSHRMREISTGDGDLTARLDASRKDELGELSGHVNSFIERIQLLVQTIGGNVSRLDGSSRELTETASSLASGAEEAKYQSTSVAAAAVEMATNMKVMAGSTESMSTRVTAVADAVAQMTNGLSNVAVNASQAASVAGEAAAIARASTDRVSQLGGAAEEIGKVIGVIQDIADQTNLLALNATIEAARAGDAGRGFAVVATEVKELARQTAAATEDVRHKIQGMQESTTAIVQLIREIGDAIKRVDEMSCTIATEIDEQNATTKSIATNVEDASHASQTVARGVSESAAAADEITRNIAGVDQVASQTAAGAAKTEIAGKQLSLLSSDLQSLVGQFRA